MAVTYPDAELQLANPVSTRPIARLVWFILHTIVGTVSGSLSGRHYHFYVRADGSVVQRQDALLRSAASVDANPYSIAIVAEDKGPAFPFWSGNDVPDYTDAQVDTIVKILVWLCRRFGMPPEAVRDSCLANGPGVAWHRLGIDGNFPAWPSIFRGRVSGCQNWSLSFGKGCPGNRRIKTINDRIIPRVIAVLRGLPPTPPPEEDDMPYLIKAPSRAVRLVVGDTAILFPTNEQLSRVRAAHKAAGIPEKVVSYETAADYDYVVRGLKELDEEGVHGAANEALVAVLDFEAAARTGPLHEILRQVLAETHSPPS